MDKIETESQTKDKHVYQRGEEKWKELVRGMRLTDTNHYA